MRDGTGQNPQTRIEQVMESVRMRIGGRHLVAGSRLPSVRVQAKAMGVSVSTVVEAYERLVAEGAIRSRPGAGFFVSGTPAPLALAEVAPRRERAIDPLWISRQALEADSGTLMPGCGWLPADWMFESGIRKALRAAARAESADLVDYASPLGLRSLREILARRLSAHGVEAAPGQVLLAESGTHAIDLVCRLLLEPGDRVLVDDPCYFNFHALLKAHRAKAVGVPFTPAGPDLEAFGAALREHAPRLYITNAAIHNPTGAMLSPVVAHRLLKLAEEAGLIIVEDDIFADFEETPAPRLAAFDGLSRVIAIGSFSKTLSASLRCGYIAARPDWIENLTDLKIATSFGSGRLSAAILAAALTDGAYRKHMDMVRRRLAEARQSVAAALAPLGIEPWVRPAAGMFLWCRLPGEADAAELAQDCLRRGVVLAPGNAFSLSQTAKGFLRFNVAQCAQKSDLEAVVAALRESLPAVTPSAMRNGR
ncbi:PLP-dependent aminotransferase family protein [Shinella daejeonensis]|uniref:aminotransferase-like domain-containing protein n=1 Tax=Shinella daejeonensis TaxID=659017 RepID=UPI0020C78302|nr:PLP-dependent aminotransferase family protein [Shinella daejeonensis]MCP8894859.1 PLP-dependent aminotransferase family protein [Shinella daejeonensis]